MRRIPEDIIEYFDLYYKYNTQLTIPENINIYLLEENKFISAIQEKSSEIFGKYSPELSDNINGLVMIDSKNKYRNTYNIFLLNDKEEIYPYIVSVLFHELSHVHTLPDLNIVQLKSKDEDGNSYIIGYNFWREFIANYIGNKTFIKTCGCIDYIDNKPKLLELLSKTIQEMTTTKELSNIDEIIPYILLYKEDLSDDILEKIGKEKTIILMNIVDICKNILMNENIKDLPIEYYNQLGKSLKILKDN